MKIAIMQPYFFPYIGYFQAINVVDKYILYDNVNFIKKAWMNRNRHLLKNANSCYFQVPLKKQSSFRKIHEIELIEDDKWKKQMLKSIFFNYKRSKYFDDVYPLIEYVINYQTNKLTELNFQSIKSVCNYLKIKTEITADSVKYNDIEIKLTAKNIDEKDFPDLKLIDWQRKVIRILEICRIERANIFINAIGGINLYSKNVFLQNGIDLKFIKTKNIEYLQFDNDFVPDLSIIDVMMFNSPEDIRRLLNEYELV
jgi:hypothetical protein